MVEASLAIKFVYLGKSTVECAELHRMLAVAWNPRERDLVEAWVAISKAEARDARVEK